MKLTIFLLIAGCLGVHASSFAQKITLSVRNAGIESVCTDIKKQSGFSFLYDAAVLKKSGTVSLELKEATLENALKQMTAGKALDYRIIDKTVIITEARPLIQRDDITVKGVVRSKEAPGTPNLPLPGAVISIKGTKKAVVADADGNYTIKAPADATLVVTLIGYGTKEIPVNGQTSIDVVLLQTASELQEVIITAYGTSEKKENQIGSAAQITSKDLARKPSNRVDALIEGLVAGFQYEQQGAALSSARPRFQSRIRGEASFSASNDPLWVIDGIPYNTGDETNMIPGTQPSSIFKHHTRLDIVWIEEG